MKRQIIFLITVLCTLNVQAQNTEDAKLYFQQAKAQLENMLSDKEKPNYEKAIFTIENAWYDNQIDKTNFDDAITKHVEAIQELIKNNYDEKAIKQKPSLLINLQEIKDQYKQALTNWAIYTYITSPTLFIDHKDTNTISIHRPYTYSITDPMATTNWQNSQVVYLNNTHQGNCFALASLYKILADRLHSDANLCTAPSHIYIRHKDDLGTKYNIELGSKYFPGTGMISAVTYTTNQAIQNGIAQRELSTKQAIALSLVYLAKSYQHKFNNTSDGFILQCAETALQYDNKNLNAQLLKAEYLENKLTAQNKPIAQLQSQTDFIEYQKLIVHLYNEGYREMPLEMKNTMLKLYNKQKVKASNNSNECITLSFGLFDERHSNKPSERIGNTLFNTKTKKITSFTKDQTLYNNYNFDPVVFAWNIDPMFAKHPGMSPYHFAINNPIAFNDPDGNTEYYFNNKWVGTDNKQNNLLGVLRSEDVRNKIRSEMKNNGKYNISDEMLKNGSSNTEMVVIHIDVLEKSYEVLSIAERQGKNKEFGTEMSKQSDHYVSDPISQGNPVDLATDNGAEVITSGTGQVIIHSHVTGVSDQRKTVSGNADDPGPNDPSTMDKAQYEMYIIVGKSGNAEKGQSGNNYGIAERSSVINIFNKSTHKIDISIGKFNAGQIIDDFKTRKSYKK